MVEFYSAVRDQVVNQTPMGMDGGGVYLSPRIEAWAAVAELLDVPRGRRGPLIESARYLHECVEDRERSGSVFRLDVSELLPVAWEDFRARAD